MQELTDRDLLSIQEARDLVQRASQSASILRDFTQEQIDRIVENMANAGFASAESLAKLAVEETGFGKWEDKLIKNQFASKSLAEYIRSMKTVGFLDPEAPVRRVAEPMGVVAGIIPSTNPTSTVIYKAIISLKARNAIVFSPHPTAVMCINKSAEIMKRAALELGAPEDSVCCMTYAELSGTQELMSHPQIGVILATGGSALVRAAYSSGKPAYGVGPGNVPAFIERTADPEKAVKDITLSKCFDNGTVCASEQAIIVDKPLDAKVRELLIDHRSHFCSQEEIRQLEKLMLLPGQKINHKVVGQPSVKIASMAGFSVPEDTTMLIVEIGGVGKEYPLSIEKLSPVICYYVVDGWEAGCELCIKIINHGGIGHTMTLHSSDARVIERFALEKPVMRVLINTPATHGAIGYTTGLAPALTLGCGTWGGSITADNVTPMHLLNIKRLAYETAPIHKSKTSEISPEVKVHWRYDEQYRYRPASRASSMISEETAKDKPKASVIPRPSIQTEKLILPDKKYGDGISEAQVQEIVKKFPRRTK